MPGVFGALIGVIVIAVSGNKGFPEDYFPAVGKGEGIGKQVSG